MSRSICPLLLEDASSVDTDRKRNFARVSTVNAADNASFAKYLTPAPSETKAAATTTQALTAVQAATNASMTSATQAMPYNSANSSGSSAEPVPLGVSNGAQPGDYDPDDDGEDDIKVASSWRVDRSAAEIDQDDDQFGFDDFVDIINPLHHIPIIGTIYREMTGDTIKPVSRITGDVIFGAVTGTLLISTVSSVISAAYEQKTGEEPTITVADALFDIRGKDTANATMLAQANTGGSTAANTDNVKLAAAVATTGSVQATPVKVASASTAHVATQAGTAKQPYGGVMDLSAVRHNQPQRASTTSMAAASNTKGTFVGDTIFTNPALSRDAKLAALRASKATGTASNANVVTAQADKDKTAIAAASSSKDSATIAAASALSVPANTAASDKDKLGQMVTQSIDFKNAGNSHQLPPELVNDMMLMALDKYKTASNLSPSEMSIGGVN